MANEIARGSATVLINDRPAARVSDPTTHGGQLLAGSPNVLIGEYAALAAAHVFPGAQNYGDCGVLCCEQIIHQVWGIQYDEDDILDDAVAAGLASDGITNGVYDPGEHGAMTVSGMKKLLKRYHVASKFLIRTNPISARRSLQKALKANRGVIVSVDSGMLHHNIPIGVAHVILVTEGEFNRHGELTHVYINDTGDGDLPDQGLCVTIAKLLRTMGDIDQNGKSRYEILATKKSIWHQFTPTPLQTP